MKDQDTKPLRVRYTVLMCELLVCLTIRHQLFCLDGRLGETSVSLKPPRGVGVGRGSRSSVSPRTAALSVFIHDELYSKGQTREP